MSTRICLRPACLAPCSPRFMPLYSALCGPRDPRKLKVGTVGMLAHEPGVYHPKLHRRLSTKAPPSPPGSNGRRLSNRLAFKRANPGRHFSKAPFKLLCDPPGAGAWAVIVVKRFFL